MTTLHASSAAATAAYYAQYLTAAPGEVPGVWTGQQADGLGLAGDVTVEQLEALLSGRDPVTGRFLGRELVDRPTQNGGVVRAVSGFDATFSAPKSLSVWWAFAGDRRLLEAHDTAVGAALAHLERFGSTTRIRSNGARLHPDTNGLTMATFRQTTSRADDPQIHTHAVISAKVQTADGRWLALDARYLKRHQRMLGGLYQSVLRSELTHRFGVEWGPIVSGQAEIAGVPAELLALFSKRTAAIDVALAGKVDEFRQREGRDPSRWERAALSREASADTRSRKSGHGAADLMTRWQTEAADAGWSVDMVDDQIERAARDAGAVPGLTVSEVVEAVSAQRSSWARADVVQAICDVQRPVSAMPGHRWLAAIERAADVVIDSCVDLDPASETARRSSDGRSIWIEPTAPRFTSAAVLAQEEQILPWVLDAHAAPPAPSGTVDGDGLDVLQAAAAASVAGEDRVVLVVGPAGAGKTRMLVAAVEDFHRQGRQVFGLAPTAKAASVLERDTGMSADTVAKLLYEWHRSDGPPGDGYAHPAGATVVVDEGGMIGTPVLHQLVTLAERQRWRLVLVGDHRQLQAVGRGGLFGELCASGRVDELERLHRFTHRWEAKASLLLRAGDPRALDAYEAHDRIIPGTLDEHLERIAAAWIDHHHRAATTAMVASSNDHVDAINHAIQAARLEVGHLQPEQSMSIAGGERAHVGDVVATRRNDRRLVTSAGEPVRNRETWTVTDIRADGSMTVTHDPGHGTVALPADYVVEHVRLGYAATEHGYQSDTVTTSVELASGATTRRGLYVAVTRGRDENVICVITDSHDVAEARDVLEGVLAVDRADTPAVTQRRNLAQQQQCHEPVAAARCVVPDWFEPLLIEARADLATATEQRTERAGERDRLQRTLDGVERMLGDVAAATAPDRDAFAAASRRADEARWAHAAAQRRLDAAPRRERRPARRAVEDAERHWERASDYFERTRQRTAPSVECYNQARTEREQARSDVRHHDVAGRLDAMHDGVAATRRRVTALETWQCWANGHPMSDEQLWVTVDVLTDQPGWEETPDQALGHTLRNWASSRRIDLTPPIRIGPALADTGVELEL